MKKKLLALLLCVVMVVAAVTVLVACEKEDYDYEITVWVGEGMKDLTTQQIKAFNESTEANPDGIKFKATVEIQSEKASVGNMEGKPASSWPDIYCFAQDQFARAVKNGMLQQLSGFSTSAIIANNSEDTVTASKIGDAIRAYPLTADNGYFMYYDKRVITDETHLTSLEQLLADCEAAGKNFSMALANGAWYAASFFNATGCVSEWTTWENGGFKDYRDTYATDGDKGVWALQGMQKLLQSPAHFDSDLTADFDAAKPSAVVISGIWDYNTARDALSDQPHDGKYLGIAPLPSFTVEGQSEPFQLASYIGHKFMGIKPQNDAYASYYLQQLALYLTSAKCQKDRFDLSGWGPSDVSLADLTSKALEALHATATVKQGQYPIEWWTAVSLMPRTIKDNLDKNIVDDAAMLKEMLRSYDGKLRSYLTVQQ